jgi:serine/threonine protein kinase
MTDTTGDAPAGESAFDRLMDEFMDRLRRGESPDAEEYARRHPEIADEIREVFPTLHLLEEFGGVSGSGPTAGDAPASPAQLGEYVILREVGRGGMGVVYEAVQETLGRHVALKVLPPGLHRRPEQFERFRREARAAAKLHHKHRPGVRGRGAGRHALLRDAVHPRAVAGGGAGGTPPRPGPGVGHRHDGVVSLGRVEGRASGTSPPSGLRSPTPSTTPTNSVSSTAMSNRATCCSMPAGPSGSPTSGWRR